MIKRSLKRSKRSSTPTQEQMLVLVEKRVPWFSADKKSELATAALGIMNEPKHKGRPPLHAVKVAVARAAQ